MHTTMVLAAAHRQPAAANRITKHVESKQHFKTRGAAGTASCTSHTAHRHIVVAGVVGHTREPLQLKRKTRANMQAGVLLQLRGELASCSAKRVLTFTAPEHNTHATYRWGHDHAASPCTPLDTAPPHHMPQQAAIVMRKSHTERQISCQAMMVAAHHCMYTWGA